MIGKIFQGVLRTTSRGFGFVIIKDKEMEDIFIPKSSINKAIDADIVEVEVTGTSKKGLEGKILQIIKREKSHFVATIISKQQKTFFAYSPSLGLDKNIILQSNSKLKVGDRIVIEVTDWEDKNKNVIAEMTKYLSHISDASKDTLVAIHEFNLRKEFSKKVVQEAQKLKIDEKELKNRKDLTGLDCVTIDPETARDFDDSISITKQKDGSFDLGVHITDVAHFIKTNSEIDKEAFLRGNSVYFPNICIPMIPKELSSDLCSIKENEIRLTMSVLMNFDSKGKLNNYEIKRSYIKSRKRFTYEGAYELLNSSEKSNLKTILETMKELCLLLKKQRFERGSIDFALDEARVIIDKNGNPQKIEIVHYDITHQMIEECMLKANEIVAKHLSDTNKTLIYRVHEEPDSDSFKDFYELAASLGFKLPKVPTHKDIQNLFVEAKESKHIQRLSINFIRSLNLALYSIDNLGHYGLSLEHYTHFTSPIRRYSDLVIQRLLFHEEDKEKDLTEVAAHCSEKERIAFKAESSVILLKKYRLLKKIIKDDPHKIFSATITRVKPFGILFELDDLFIEGYLHVSKLYNDFYEFDPKTVRLIGRRTNKTLSFGDKVKVQITSLDLIFSNIEFKLVKKRR